ncbi:uncharacterized protein DNG_06334 [Cephalotrichum gorgonifer]|uniref:Beta-lactamase domain-containing protein n=1 Tax=Cephalotrichum gorgonifer TaxID=2041049 RepID=A0AAE8MZF4_9PEZI|nr:uncharacterized protein DNG_06334 [Cephalotrichum gorgonifer]
MARISSAHRAGSAIASSVGDAAIVLPTQERQPETSVTLQTKGNPLNDGFKKFIDSTREKYHVPGVAIGVVHGDETYLSGYGHATLDGKVAVTPETLFYIGSITKSTVGAILLHVLESTVESDKPLTLNSKIHDIIPGDFLLSDDYTTRHATLKDALVHRLGYPRHDMSYGGPGFTVKDAVRSLRHLPMSAELREKFQYFNIGFMVLQHVIESITGKFLGEIYEEAFFGPLGMTSSTVELSKARDTIPHTLAEGSAYSSLTKTINPQPWWDSCVVGDGGVITNVADMTKYLRAMINGGAGLPISEESYKTLTSPVIIGDAMPAKYRTTPLYAAGWFVSSYRGHHYVYHSGAVPGFTAMAGYFPDLKWGAVVTTNADLSGIIASETVFYRLVDDFLEVPEDDRVDSTEKWENLLNSREESYLKGREKAFPSIPDPPLPHSLPLQDYAGTYFHPAYRSLTFAVALPESDIPVAEGTASVLHAVKDQSEWDIVFDLEHVSGEHFICYLNTLARSPMLQEAVKAEFVVGPDGKVARLGIEFESSLKDKIWFDRA